jgi:IPT/TIG domain-containing protein
MVGHGVTSRHWLIIGLVAGAMASLVSVSNAGGGGATPSGTWQELPNTKIRDVLPDPTGYPIDPLTFEALWNPVNIMDYSGGVQIPGSREIVVDGGGHHEYPGNEKYSVPYDGRPVSRIGMPSLYTVDGSTNETYPDGRPAQRHTTDSMVFLPDFNAIFKTGGGLWEGGWPTAAAWLFYLGTQLDERLPDHPPGDYGAKSLYSVAKWHPGLNKIVVRGRNYIALYDPFARVWEEKAYGSWNESEMTGILDTKRNRLVNIGHGRSEVWDLGTWQRIYDSEDTAGPIPFSGPTFHDVWGPGFVYDEIGDQYIGWSWLTPSMLYFVNPDTWAITAATMAGTPPPQLAWSSGTFGRFVRVTDPFDGVAVVHSIDSNAFKVVFDRGTPAPAITSISPSSVVVGGPGFTLTVNGTGFTATSVVRVNGSDRATAFGSATRLTATILASDIAAAGTQGITVFNPDSGRTSPSVTLSITNPVPTLSSIVPATLPAGGPDFTLTLAGSNFVSASVVRVNGSPRATTLVSTTQLTATILAGDIASPGTLSITVFTPGPGGGTSGALAFTVTALNPVPVLSTLVPSSALQGGPAFTLTVTGSGFVPSSTVSWNGSSRATTFVSATQLTAAIPASDLVAAGTVPITVFSPGPGGGTSGAQAFTVTALNPGLVLLTLTPSTAVQGGPAFTLTVTGSGFVRGSAVRWNGSKRTTKFVSATQLTAAIHANDLAAAGTVQVTVVNSVPGSPGGSTSNALPFAITAAIGVTTAPVISSAR